MGLMRGSTLLYPEALVMDSEIYHSIRSNLAGIDTREEMLALDVIKAVGHRGHYLRQKHTRKHIRQLQLSELTGQPDPEGGFRDPVEVAREKTDWILENHHPQPLEEHQQRELTRILDAAEREFTGGE
jgi:trimethylamine--corrinoid protein Co-methyltransferase